MIRPTPRPTISSGNGEDCDSAAISFAHSFLKAEEEDINIQAVADQIQVLTKDLKTLEKAVNEELNDLKLRQA